MQISETSELDFENFYTEEIWNVFTVTTKDFKKTIDINELFALMQSIGQSNFEIDDNLALTIQKEDSNILFSSMQNNGQIHIQEFIKYLKAWLRCTGTLKLFEHLNIYFSQLVREDKILFHKILSSFFLHKKNDMFSVIINVQSNLQDIINLIDYMDFNFTFNKYPQDKKNMQISLTTYHIELFNEIVSGIQNTDIDIFLKALEKLLSMLNIINLFTLSQERLSIFSIFLRIFDLIHNSSMIPRLISILNILNINNENENSPHLSIIKVNFLKIFSLLSSSASFSDNDMFPKNQDNLQFNKIAIELSQNDFQRILFDQFNSNYQEVKDQVAYCIGSFTLNKIPINIGFLQTIFPIFFEGNTSLNSGINSHKCALWLLIQLIKGNYLNQLASSKIVNYENICIKLKQELLFEKSDEAILLMSIISLGETLYLCKSIPEINELLSKLIEALSISKGNILYCLLHSIIKTICLNDLHIKIMLSLNLLNMLSLILSNPMDSKKLKLNILTLIKIIAKKGYIGEIITSKILFCFDSLLNDEESILIESLLILKYLSKGSSNFVIALIDQKLIINIFNSLPRFTRFDDSLSKNYGYYKPFYDFKILNLCVEILRSVLQKAGMNAEVYCKCYERDSFEKLKFVCDTILDEYEKNNSIIKSKLITEYNFFADILSLIAEAKQAFDLLNNEIGKANSIFLNSFGSTLSSKIQLISNQNNYTSNLIGESNKLEVKCFSEYGYPNGDNRLFSISINSSLVELLQNISYRYNLECTHISFIDNYGEKITIDSEESFIKAKQTVTNFFE